MFRWMESLLWMPRIRQKFIGNRPWPREFQLLALVPEVKRVENADAVEVVVCRNFGSHETFDWFRISPHCPRNIPSRRFSTREPDGWLIVKAMREAKLEAGIRVYYPLTEQQRTIARQLIQDYIQEHGYPDAIFCHSDDVALGIYRGLCDIKLKVPEDVALVGCDGIQDTEYLECQLTQH